MKRASHKRIHATVTYTKTRNKLWSWVSSLAIREFRGREKT